MSKDFDWVRAELVLRKMSVVRECGAMDEYLDLAEQLRRQGFHELSSLKVRELTQESWQRQHQLMDANSQIVEALIESYVTSESKEWRQEVERRLVGMVKLLEGVSELLEVEININSYDASEYESQADKRSQEMRNFEDEYYKIIVNSKSWVLESRHEYIEQRERVERLMMTIRAVGV
ncbi:hypothetical protein [Vibrio atypicus]|uniref:hypothetical protein n=1 Tax=Vibrio atypicus TaxID=558271 RepID=UPI00373589EB